LIKGTRICLTEVRREDSETMYRWINDAETVRYNAPYSPVSWANHGAWFDGLGKNPSRVVLAIRSIEDQAIIGVIQLLDIHPVHRTAELTTRIGDDKHRGKGHGTEALKLAISFAWRDLNLQRIWLRVFATNARAIRAYEKAGFTTEGTLRRAAWIDGQWVDELAMAVLREV
jgi:RimJ/RimL family protein N-acetyltransferase